MSDDVTCEHCGETFDDENALQQHTYAVHPETVQEPAFAWDDVRPWFNGLIVLLAVGLFGYAAYDFMLPWFSQPNLPQQGDHWHAEYSIKICGQRLPDRPYSQGGIHTHGSGRIHIHPHTEREEGRAANLGRFFRSFNGTLTSTTLHVPGHGRYENGDRCPGGERGRVQVYVNGETITNPATYVPQDGDVVRFVFGSPSGRTQK